MNDMKTKLCRVVFGSRLYGTNTPESDFDFKEVWMPSAKSIVMKGGRFVNCHSTGGSKQNTSDDVDTEVMSIFNFMKLLFKGETMCIDMLHAPLGQYGLMKSSPMWEELRANRSEFYTTNMSAFLGYARSQATKYGVKGERLDTIMRVKGVVDSLIVNARKTKLADIAGLLPVNELAFFGEMLDNNGRSVKYYDLLGRKQLLGISVEHFRDAVNKIHADYGSRAHAAANASRADWKALSHALRVTYQMKEIYETGDLVMPLRMADRLRDIKTGLIPIDDVTEELNQVTNEVTNLVTVAKKNGMRDSVDTEKWSDWLYQHVMESMISDYTGGVK